MSFTFDAREALAEIRNRTCQPATAAIPATETTLPPETVAGVAAIAGGDAENGVDTADLDAFTERASILEYDGGLSREAAEQRAAEAQGFASTADLYAAAVARWASDLHRLAAREAGPTGRRRIASALRFIHDGWTIKALALGWTELELVGADPRAPWARLDRLGAAYSPFVALAVTEDAITFAPSLRRWRGAQAHGALLPWEAAP